MTDFVQWLQTKLKSAGIDPGPIDGLDGAKTRAAVESLFDKLPNIPVVQESKSSTIVLNKKFFDSVRESVFSGSFNSQTLDYMTNLCNAFNEYGDGDIRKLAYIFATANREGGWKYDYEIWGPTRQQRKYERPNSLAFQLGNVETGDGYKFRGRGFGCMITGRTNYAKWSKILGLDLVSNPDLAARHDVAARICVEGSMLGSFTGKKLGDYITSSKTDYVNARRVINSLDHAQEIANVAEKFEKALS